MSQESATRLAPQDGLRNLRVLIVDDHTLFAEAIARTLEQQGMEILGTAATGSAALLAVDDSRPDVVLIDPALPDLPGRDVAERILERHPEIRVVVVASAINPELIQEAMDAGCSGCVSKNMPVDEFVASLRTVAESGSVDTPDVLIDLTDERSPDDVEAALLASQLTRREREVLALLVRGSENAHVAQELGMSTNTVRTHVENIRTKLQVHSRLEAAAFAVRHGLVAVPVRRSR
jgi:DNA-binding NarL/FixJ family response regulator